MIEPKLTGTPTISRRGPTSRRTARLIVLCGATVVLTILAVPCGYAAVASLYDATVV